jgi:hypothetical protein
LYILTVDGKCHFCRYEGLEIVRSLKLGSVVRDAMMIGDRILAVGDKLASTFVIDGDRPLRKQGEVPLTNSKKIIARDAGGWMALIHRGKGVLGDTLVVYEAERMGELGRLAFTGRTDVVTPTDDGVILRLEGGLAVHASISEKGEIGIAQAGFLPFDFSSAGGDASLIHAISNENRLYVFPFDAVVPRPMNAGDEGSITVPLRIYE